MTATLSPITHAGLRSNGMLARLLSDKPAKPEPPEIETVLAYRCPKCDELHEDRSDAVECCAIHVDGADSADGDVACPVCATGHSDHREAADCCLWRDLDAPTRWRIADAVDAGATWEDAMAAQGVKA